MIDVKKIRRVDCHSENILLKCRKVSLTSVIICAKVCVCRVEVGEDVEFCEIVFRLFVCTYIICISICMYVHTRVLRTYSSRSRYGRVVDPSENTASSWDTTL